MAAPSFINLWRSYPKKSDPCDGPWANQCAIRLSIALNGDKTILVSKGTYSEPRCAHGHARGAESLANWLWKYHLKRPKIHSNPAKGKLEIQAKTGIVFFRNCFVRAGETQRLGDHIDLWNRGLTKTYNDPANRSQELWFWELA